MLHEDRVREMFWLFSQVLPFGDEDKEVNKVVFGASVAEILPDLAQTIGHSASKNLELLEEYLDFIQQAIKYCKGESNDQPNVQYDSKLVFKDWQVEKEKFDKTAKPAEL